MVHEAFHILGAIKADVRFHINEHGEMPAPEEVDSIRIAIIIPSLIGGCT